MKQQWYNNDIIEVYTSKPETLPEEFIKGRLKPALIELKARISKEELFNYYMIENHPYEETVEHFNITRGHLRMLLDAYNIKKTQKMAAKNNKYKRSSEEVTRIAKLSSETQKQTWANKSPEEKEAWTQLQIDTHSTSEYKERQSQIIKDTNKNIAPEIVTQRNIQRSNTLKNLWEENKDELLAKRKQSEKQNRKNSTKFCRTYLEQKIYDVLRVDFPSIQYDVKISDQYPYFVDFYIPEQELFIEIQGHPSHGKIPYNPSDKRSLQEAYALYGEWLRIYTIVDVEKYKTAVDNNLNFLRVYPFTTIEENFKINNQKHNAIIEKIFTALE